MPHDAPAIETPLPPPTDAPELPAGHEEAFGALAAMSKEMASPVDPPPKPVARARRPDGTFEKIVEKAPEKPAIKPEAKPAEEPKPVEPEKFKNMRELCS